MSGRDASERRFIDRFRADMKRLGNVRRIVATTHNLEPDFFEHDFLPTVLDVPNVEDHSFKARLELQRRLAQCELVTVAMEASAYDGRPSLRTALRPVALRGQRLHAKLMVVQYEHGVKVAVGSANLTSAGFRSNREVVGVLETRDETPGDIGAIRAVLREAQTTLAALRSRGAADVLDGLAAVASDIEAWHPGTTPTQELLWSGGDDALARKFVAQWPGSAQVERVHIVSPFWSEDGSKNAPLAAFLGLLRADGKLAERCSVDLYMDACALQDGSYTVAFPAGFALAAEGLERAEIVAHAVDPRVEEADLDMKVELNRARSLHAKIIVLEGGGKALGYAGSANFTRAGWGFGARGNVELGWLLRGSTKALAQLIPATTGEAQPLRPGSVIEPEEPPDAEHDAFWPTYILGAELEPDPDDVDRLVLVVQAEADAPHFTVSLLGADEQPGVVLLEGGNRAGEEVRTVLGSAPLRQILIDREVLVTEVASGRSAEFPVNVAAGEARLRLPIAPGAARPGEAALVAYYQGRVAFEDLFPEPGDVSTIGGPGPRAVEESGVDTSRILSYQIRAFVEALPGIRAEVLEGSVSRPALEHRLLGAVSPVALASAILGETVHRNKSAVAAAFQLVELANLIESVAAKADSEVVREVCGTAAQRIRSMLEKVKAREPERFTAGTAFAEFESAVAGGAA